MIPATGIYIAITATIFLVLAVRVIMYRRRKKISLGDDGDKGLLKRMRAHANLVEYAPLALIMLAALEMNGAPKALIHVLGLTFVIGRILHAYGFSASPPKMNLRILGMVLTLGMMAFGISALVAASII